jgi:hypothetical protein
MKKLNSLLEKLKNENFELKKENEILISKLTN